MFDIKNPLKKQKLGLAKGNRNDLEKAGPSNQQPTTSSPPSEIFKLTADCCDEIFEYLSIVDLHSFGQTCKIFKKVAGAYFKRNFFANSYEVNEQGIYIVEVGKPISLSGFNGYVTKVRCTNSTSMEYLAQQGDKFTSIKSLEWTVVNPQQPNIAPKILSKIERLSFVDLINEPDETFVANLSQLCPKLQTLLVTLCPLELSEHKWLHQNLPNLREIKCGKFDGVSVDIVDFLERNLSIRSASVKFEAIWDNRDRFKNSSIKLDLFEVECYHEDLSDTVELLNQLYERGFYKSLHLVFHGIHLNGNLHTIQGLEKLSLSVFQENDCLPQLKALKRLDLKFCDKQMEMELLVRNLVNLQRVSISTTSFQVLVPLFRRLANLNKVYVLNFRGKVLNLSTLNKERKKLTDARKVTIYVDDELYMASKWASKNGDTNLSLVEMRRVDSIEWNLNIKK